MMPTGIRINVLEYTFHYKFTTTVQYIFLVHSSIYTNSAFTKLLERSNVPLEFLFKHHRIYSYRKKFSSKSLKIFLKNHAKFV